MIVVPSVVATWGAKELDMKEVTGTRVAKE
jgi:hypothetical protein